MGIVCGMEDREAEDRASEIVPRVYEELRRLAAVHLREERPGHTLQATALVNEAYLRLVQQATEPGEEVTDSRDAFVKLASRIMRNVLVDHARTRSAKKRGGEWHRITLDGVQRPEEESVDVLALDDALNDLVRYDPRMARLIELRFFGGMTETEAAEAMGVSRSDATRRWRMARAWLSHRLRGSGADA